MKQAKQAAYQKTNFTSQLLLWNAADNQRSMPWKDETDPYKIWLSEIILQQTRVEQGWAYYLVFIKKYPRLQLLAAAPQEEVFKLWEGLGYYSRCRNLIKAAQQVMELHNGHFPTDYQQILNLKGVGPYTAAAIASFAFGAPYAVVDGNVIRVLARFFGIKTPFDTTGGKKEFAELAQQLLPPKEAGIYNQAIMDFGAVICKPASPNCHQCPLNRHCTAFNLNLVQQLPVKSKRLQKKSRYFAFVVLASPSGLLVSKRSSKDIWLQLHQFWLLENQEALCWTKKQWQQYFHQQKWTTKFQYQSEILKQQLTHQTIEARFVVATCPSFPAPEGYFWASPTDLSKLAFPQVIRQFFTQYPDIPSSII